MATASNQNYTLTYDPGSKGFPSFYSYAPDWMIGMNNFFYTFKNGNLYRHNTNELRNNYYGINYPSTLTSVFNDQPLENKLFKTINSRTLVLTKNYMLGTNYKYQNFYSLIT